MVIDYMDVGLKMIKESASRELTDKELRLFAKLQEWEGVTLRKQTKVGAGDESN